MRLSIAVVCSVGYFSTLVLAYPGGDQAYPVYGPDEDGNEDYEFTFGLAAINTLRAQCESDPSGKFSGQYPPVTADDVSIYDDECRSRVVGGQRLITLSFDVPSATDSMWESDGIYVIISTAEAVGDLKPASDVDINATGYAADFRLVAVRKYDDESGEGSVPWSCDFEDWQTGELIDGELGEDNSTDYLLDGDEEYDFDYDDEDSDSASVPPRKKRRTSSRKSGDDIVPKVGGRKYLRVEDVTQHAHGAAARRRRVTVEDTLSAADRAEILKSLPKNYDARAMTFPIPTPPMITVPTDQGGCSSCWAFAGTTALSWRLYLQSKGKYNVIPSQQIAMTCGSQSCDEGGESGMVFETAYQGYLPAAAAAPYTMTIDEEDIQFCENREPTASALRRIKSSITYQTKAAATDVGVPDQHVATTTIQGIEAAMKEIFENGPVGIDINWEDLLGTYPANPSVCNGIQTDRACTASKTPDDRLDDGKSCVIPPNDLNHAVVAVGWGEDPKGCPDQGLPGPIKYWIIQNSHGAGTGDCDGIGCGFYKIERGVNAFGLDTSGILATVVDLENMQCNDVTEPSKFCQNGGSFNRSCGCYCPKQYGFTGPTCTTCSLKCDGGVEAVVIPADAMKGVPAMCKCPCASGYWSPTNLALDDCALAVGLWVGDSPDRSKLTDFASQDTAPATFNWLFTKRKELERAGYSPWINKGDFLVAVAAGTKPWTPETNWDGAVATADICGPKLVEDKQLVGCNPYGGWDLLSESDRGTLTIDKEGIYDVYFVKYNGVSEFGVDKGFGKNFALLPQKLVVGAANVALLESEKLAAIADRNRQAQLEKQSTSNAAKIETSSALNKLIDLSAAKKQATQDAAEAPRSAFLRLYINGINLADFGMLEETSFKSILAQYAGAVCTPDASKKASTSKYANCTVRDAWVQRTDTNVTTALKGGSGIVVYGKVTTNESAAVSIATASLTKAIDSGAMLKALITSGGYFTRSASGLCISVSDVPCASSATGTPVKGVAVTPGATAAAATTANKGVAATPGATAAAATPGPTTDKKAVNGGVAVSPSLVVTIAAAFAAVALVCSI